MDVCVSQMLTLSCSQLLPLAAESTAWWRIALGLAPAASLPVCFLLLMIGMALITKGGDLFTDCAVAIARATRIPTVIVGATIVSMATTFPELMVSLTSALSGVTDFAVGNALGSCCCNIGLIVGSCAILKFFVARSRGTDPGIPVARQTLRSTGAIMLVAGLMTWLFAVLGRSGGGPLAEQSYSLNRWHGAILLAGLLFYMAFTIRQALRARFESELAEHDPSSEQLPRMSTLSMVGGFASGAVVVVIGSKLLVSNAEQIALAMEVPRLIVGLTILAIGTSLPEYTISLLAVIKGHGSLGLGNIMGANILNLCMVVGACASIQPLAIQWQTIALDAPIVLLLMVLLLALPYKKQLVSARAGVILFGVYVAYLILMLTQFNSSAQ